ncbi:MAG: tetratricopeptide repeat protein [Burkholderiales bacterium]|nr:tetratricopeptide repeat protein [Burkholderiales bacterium]
MAGFNPRAGNRWRRAALAMAFVATCAQAQERPRPPAPAKAPANAPEPAPVSNSRLDAPLFYQLLIGELELREGRVGSAFEVMLDAARRSGDDKLYQRAIEIAMQSRAGEQALSAARTWRQARPKSIDALRFEAQILLALNRIDEMAAPLSLWLAEVPLLERPALISALPRLLHRAPDRKQALALAERVLEPYRTDPGSRVAALVALGRTHLAAGNAGQALALAHQAQAVEPQAIGPALLALDMLPGSTEAERLLKQYLALPDAEPGVRLGYVQTLTQSQRYADASAQLEVLTQQRPMLPQPWLSLGALRVELKQAREAEAALQHYLELVGRTDTAPPPDKADKADKADEDDARPADTSRDLTQAWLLLAQAAELRSDLKAAESWLARIDNPQRALEVQSRKASILARQGKLREARALIQAVPERKPEDARAKLLAEAQVLRESKRWRDAASLLSDGNKRFPDDVDLLYEQAMAEEKVERFAEMERLLRRVMDLNPKHPHAPNALGYSLADRNLRLPEARDLIRRALDLSPGDPFITDSLGWVEFRLGNRDEAARLLREAYRSRPDTEIAAHLGEVLWAMGQRDEARRIWQDARGRDADNEVLRETLVRLKVSL